MKRQMIVIMCILAMHSRTSAQVTAFTNEQAWQTATAHNYSTINFTGFADGTMITNQYADSGVTFLGFAQIFQSPGFVNDGWGLYGVNGLRFRFASPQNWIAVNYPGGVRIQLINQGQVLYTSPFYIPGGTGNFAGLVSAAEFDEVYIDKGPPLPNHVFIDDLHWGAPVPAPGAVGMLGFIILANRRRRNS